VTLGVLTTVDLEAFEIGCLHYGMAAELHHEITHVVDQETGKTTRRTTAQYVTELTLGDVNGVPVMKPQIYERLAVVYAMRSLHASALKVLGDFGLTPAARSRLDLAPPEPGEVDPVERMMNDS
jgi:phage terminase small subunit